MCHNACTFGFKIEAVPTNGETVQRVNRYSYLDHVCFENEMVLNKLDDLLA